MAGIAGAAAQVANRLFPCGVAVLGRPGRWNHSAWKTPEEQKIHGRSLFCWLRPWRLTAGTFHPGGLVQSIFLSFHGGDGCRFLSQARFLSTNQPNGSVQTTPRDQFFLFWNRGQVPWQLCKVQRLWRRSFQLEKNGPRAYVLILWYMIYFWIIYIYIMIYIRTYMLFKYTSP